MEAQLPSFSTSALDTSARLPLRPSYITPGGRTPAPIDEEAVWAPAAVWTIWRREKSVATICFDFKS